MVVAFRRQRSPYGSYVCDLRGIDESATYEVTDSRGYHPSPPRKVKGAALRHLKAEIEECPGSLVFEYRRAAK